MREWLVDLVGESMAPIASFVLAAAIVVILVFIVIWVAKQALGGQTGLRAKGRGPRLAVMDVTAIDQKRKLVLVRRDEVEHLILIGGQNDLVVEASILRVAAGSRSARAEPTFRADDGGEHRPSAPPQRLPTAMTAGPAANQQTRRAQAGTGRTGDGPTTSPLARAVPRAPSATETATPPAPQVAKATPTAEPIVEVPSAAPIVAVERPAPVPAAPETPPAAPQRREPSFATMASASPTADTTPSPQATPRPETTETEAAADKVRADNETDIVSGPGEQSAIPAVASPEPKADMVRSRAEPARQAAPAVENPAPLQTSPTGAERPLPPRHSAIERAPFASQLPTRVPITTPPSTASDGPARDQRASVSSGSEPFRRVSPTVPGQARSLATPTYPTASPFQLRPEEPTSTAPAKDADSDRTVDIQRDRTTQTMDSGPSADAAKTSDLPTNTSDSAGMKEIAPRPFGPSSAIIAAAERQRELLRNRPGTLQDAVETETPPAPTGSAAEKPEQLPIAPPAEAEAQSEKSPPSEKKPLEVKSFAATIQAGGRPINAPSTPFSRPAPAPTPVRMAEPSWPTVKAPVSPVARQIDAEKPQGQPGDDAFAGLEDFLSAELDFGLDDVNWNDEPGNAAPEVRLDEPKPDSAKRAAAEPKPDAPPKPQALTLEEEMERLLGDFNFETSDNKKR